jgi:predicted GNAT family acetyltransferase
MTIRVTPALIASNRARVAAQVRIAAARREAVSHHLRAASDACTDPELRDAIDVLLGCHTVRHDYPADMELQAEALDDMAAQMLAMAETLRMGARAYLNYRTTTE